MAGVLNLSSDLPIMVGTDLDGYLSWIYLHNRFGCRLGGFYNLREIWLAPGITREDLISALWIDLDVYHREITSFGQHIIKLEPGDRLPKRNPRSFNPNLERGFAVHSNFQRKYPFATVHMLMWALDDDGKWTRASAEARALLWAPDSSWLNARKYRGNAREWLQNFFDHDLLLAGFDWITTPDFLRALGSVQRNFEACGFSKGASRSKNKGSAEVRPYAGWQCSIKDPGRDREKLEALVNYCSKVLGLKPPQLPFAYRSIRGKRHQETVAIVLEEGGLDTFLEEYRVFSYAFPFYFIINYSTDLDPFTTERT